MKIVRDTMTGVPATTKMHFRNGAVAISYVATLLLVLVDVKKVTLDDKLSKWLPDVPHADQQGTLRAPLPAVGTRPASGIREGHAKAVERQGIDAARADQHRQLVHCGDWGAVAARVHQ